MLVLVDLFLEGAGVDVGVKSFFDDVFRMLNGFSLESELRPCVEVRE